MISTITQKYRLLFFCFLINAALTAQSIRDYTLEVTCTSRVYNSTQSILEFKWPYRAPVPDSQLVYRKNKDILGWGSIYKVLGIADSTFNDTILTGSQYEYKFEKDTGYDGYTVTGYALAGDRVPAVTYRGKILILADSSYRNYLENDIRTYRNDLIGDGWQTELFWLDSASDQVSDIKSLIVNRYTADPANLKSVVLIGHLAVPYTGDFDGGVNNFPPDGHTTIYSPPSHEGAWSTDYYYACMNNPIWPDSTVSNNLGARLANRNNPNDGKFDFTHLSEIDALNSLQVGRINMFDLPAFAAGERELLKRYFVKNHNFKHKINPVQERCLVDDNVGLVNNPYPFIDEHFANNAYRNMAGLISNTSTFNRDYLSTLDTASYLWSFGIGFGSYTNATGVAMTSQLADTSQEVRSVFNGFTGSYFGDWDNSNNLMKAVLAAKGYTLNAFFCGRPHYFFHHMGLGETIGYSVLRTQNNIDTITNADLLYPTTAFSYWQIHVNMLGDPAVRNQPVYPAENFLAYQDSCHQRVKLSWQASVDTAVHTYYVFRAKHIDSSFTLLKTTDSLNWTDSFPLSENVYMLRGSKLQTSGSGSYFNLSQGLFDTLVLMQNFTGNRDTSICLNTTARIGRIQNLPSTVTYSWIPAQNDKDTFTIQITGSATYILTAEDTLGRCIVRDSIQVNTLRLPGSETISSFTNACSDSVAWSSTSNNGAGYTYTWNFPGGSPSDTGGPVLINPGVVLYPSTGNYLTRLRISNDTTLCEHTDTQTVNVICSSLPANYSIINCINTIKGRELRFMVYNNEAFKSFTVEISINGIWESIAHISAHQDRYYTLSHPDLNHYEELRIIGHGKDEQSIVLGTCHWTDVVEQWSVFPNPTNSEIRLTFNGQNGRQISYIQLFNSQGISVLTTQMAFNQSSLYINMTHLSVGIYTLLIQTGELSTTFKILKVE